MDENAKQMTVAEHHKLGQCFRLARTEIKKIHSVLQKVDRPELAKRLAMVLDKFCLVSLYLEDDLIEAMEREGINPGDYAPNCYALKCERSISCVVPNCPDKPNKPE